MKKAIYFLIAICVFVGTQGCLPTLTVTNYSICQGNTVPSGQGMQASTTLTSAINWYTTSTGGSPIFTGTVFNPIGVTGSGLTNTNTVATTTYYAIEQTSSSSRTAVTFTVNPSPTSTITPPANTIVCAGGPTVTMSANTATGLTYQWKLNGTNITGATNATYSTNVAGSYTVGVSNATCGPVVSTAVVLSAGTPPTATATAAGPTTFCPGGSVVLNANTGTGLTYQWQLNGTNITGATNASYSAGGTGSYTVVVANATGCNATSSAIAVNANGTFTITVTAVGALSVCQGSAITLNANSGATGLTYQWNLNGTPISGATNASVQAGVAGVYTVTAHSSTSGCTQTSIGLTVTIIPLPNSYVTYAAPLAFCDGGAVVLTGNTSSGLTYQWQQDGNAISGATNYYQIIEQTGNYTVVTTDANNCSATSPAVNVTVYTKPNPIVTRNGTLFSTANTFSSYQWYVNHSQISGAVTNTCTATQNGAYAVEVSDGNGCFQMSDAVFISNLSVTNVSGNGDQITIYPNPAAKTVFIDAPQKELNIYLCTMDGRLVRYWLNTKQIDISDIAEGNYMLTLLNNENQIVKVEKLLKTGR
jgi:hypothetical protein